MPRAQNPIADLKTLDAKAAQIMAKRAEVEQSAHAFIGKLIFDTGLDDWDVKDLKAGFKYLKELGPATIRKPGKPKSAPPPSPTATASAIPAE
ncbi:MAG: hypothetical protein AAFN03_11480 [Pseudomonadota bacterium]